MSKTEGFRTAPTSAARIKTREVRLTSGVRDIFDENNEWKRTKINKIVLVVVCMLTGMGSQMGLQTLFPREDPIAEGTFYTGRRGATLHHEVGQGVGTRSTASVRLWGRFPLVLVSAVFTLTIRHITAAVVTTAASVLWRGARASRAQVYITRLLAPVPRIQHRITHGWTTAAGNCAVDALRRVQLHAASGKKPCWSA